MHAEALALEQHRWLHRLRGEWAYESTPLVGSGEPADKVNGIESVRALGDLWVVAGGHTSTPSGSTAHSVMTLGFEPVRSRFIGTADLAPSTRER
jgi:hypothetical protein